MTIDQPEYQADWDREVLNAKADEAYEQAVLDAHETHDHVLICTCCRPARPIVEDGAHWDHEHDATLAMTLHAHVERARSDCDGRRLDAHTVRPNSTGKVAENGYQFKRHTVSWLPKHFRPGGVLVIERDGAYWRAPTDEGSEAVQVTWCEDPACAYEDSWQRDVFAQQMGY